MEDRLVLASERLERGQMAVKLSLDKQKALPTHYSDETTRQFEAEIDDKRVEELAKLKKIQAEEDSEKDLAVQFGDCEIRAPFDGQIFLAGSPYLGIGGAQLTEGSSISLGQRIFRMLYVAAVTDGELMVPVDALLIVDGKTRLVAVKKLNGGFDWREVEIGQSKGRLVQIKAGLIAGELVMVEPYALVSKFPAWPSSARTVAY